LIVEVCRTRQGFSAPGLTVHTSRHLAGHHTAKKSRIPVTTPARTLVDLAGCLPGRVLDDHLSAAKRLGLLDCREIRRVIADTPRPRGVQRLTAQIELFEQSEGVPRSELETRFLRLCSDGGLPLPVADVPISSEYVDFYWHEQRLIVEVDSRAFHVHRFDEDRSRDLAHLVNGYRTVRVTHLMMEQSPGRLIESLRVLLDSRRGRNGGASRPGARETDLIITNGCSTANEVKNGLTTADEVSNRRSAANEVENGLTKAIEVTNGRSTGNEVTNGR
jgi:hypothetical protein